MLRSTSLHAKASLFVASGLALSLVVLASPANAESGGQSPVLSADRPVVVELFTSQGCSSCPPADALLGELAQRDDVVALSMHVDYWDYIGWKDPFASPQITERQRRYSRELGKRFVYTPQIVVDGRHDVVGSRRGEVTALIEQAKAAEKPLTLSFRETNGGEVVIPAGQAPDEGATVWLAVYDESHETDIQRGENRGRKLRYSNVVRELEELAVWRGEELVLPVDLVAAAARGRDGCAVIVQHGRTGPILGAIAMDLPAS